MRDVFLDAPLIELAWDIKEDSPDPMVELALVYMVLATRHFGGEHAGYAWISPTSYAQFFRIGRKRVEDGLDRLVKMGILEREAEPYQYGKYRYWYRVMLAVDENAPTEIRPASERKVRSLEERQQELKNTPRDIDGPKLPVVMFNMMERRMVRVLMPARDADIRPVCKVCGLHYDWQLGDSPEKDVCYWCWTQRLKDDGEEGWKRYGVSFSFKDVEYIDVDDRWNPYAPSTGVS